MQSTLVSQVLQEREGATRVTHGDEVLEKGDLHLRLWEHQIRMPSELGLLIEELHAEIRSKLLTGHSYGHVGRSETDSDEVNSAQRRPLSLSNWSIEEPMRQNSVLTHD